MIPTRRALFVALLAALSAGCGVDETITAPSTPGRSVEVFNGRLSVGGSQFYSVRVSDLGTTDVTLTSLRPAGVTTSTLTAVVGIGVGTPKGTDCALTSALDTAPGLTRQLSARTDPGTICVRVTDIGNLHEAADYTVRVEYP